MGLAMSCLKPGRSCARGTGAARMEDRSESGGDSTDLRTREELLCDKELCDKALWELSRLADARMQRIIEGQEQARKRNLESLEAQKPEKVVHEADLENETASDTVVENCLIKLGMDAKPILTMNGSHGAHEVTIKCTMNAVLEGQRYIHVSGESPGPVETMGTSGTHKSCSMKGVDSTSVLSVREGIAIFDRFTGGNKLQEPTADFMKVI